jgi:aryl-alcohol dehydrogenase-like predicted oxidoreductase
LASSDPGVWPQIDGVDPADTIALIATLVHEFGRESAADLCLAFVRGQDWIDGVVVGMETSDQLETDLHLFIQPPLTASECEEIERRVPKLPEQLLNPALWP